MNYFLDIAYFLALVATAPFYIGRMIFQKRYRSGWRHRLGLVPRRYGLQPVIWVHGVSVGEVNAARPLVEEIHRQLPGYRVIVSSTTDTGIAAAERAFSPAHTVFHWPLDFTWAVSAALERIRPAVVVLMEGEIWPNFLAECNRRDIPALVVNGRISPNKGFPRYKLLGRITAQLFNRLAAIGVQDEIYGEKYMALGVDPEKIHLTGMLKFESIDVADAVEGQDELAAAMGLAGNAPLLVAGGTGSGEEEILLDCWETLKEDHETLRLAVVPRKPERFDDVARLITSRGHDLLRRSLRPDGCAEPPPEQCVILGDTMGELKKFYALATVAFVGRSLVPMGGSDMIEAAALGKPTCFGPHTFNFPQTDGLLKHGCAEVADAEGLARRVRSWLDDPDIAIAAGKKSQQYIRRQQGAAERNTVLICRLLGLREPLGPAAIATPSIVADNSI